MYAWDLKADGLVSRGTKRSGGAEAEGTGSDQQAERPGGGKDRETKKIHNIQVISPHYSQVTRKEDDERKRGIRLLRATEGQRR